MNYWRMYGVKDRQAGRALLEKVKQHFTVLKVHDWGNKIIIYTTEEIPDGFGDDI